MTHNKSQLRRLVLLEGCLAVGGILLVSCLCLYAISGQQKITEELFRHPFAVSNAGLEFRSDVLEFRNYMLETMLPHKQNGDTQLAGLRRIENNMDIHLAVIHREFLGDQALVSNIVREFNALKKVRELLNFQLGAGDSDKTVRLAIQQTSPHIEQILADTDNVISFARLRGMRFVEEGQAQIIQARLLLVLLAGLLLTTYLLLANKLRQKIYTIYDIEEHDATFDALCESYNRRSFIKLVEAEIMRARRHVLPLSMLMIDFDHFKKINDTHGHDAGDSVLNQFGMVCRQHLRGGDVFGRIGGEEFGILLPYTDLNGAMNIAERIRQEIADFDFKTVMGNILRVTISIGVTNLDEDNATGVTTLLKRADEAMYRSKLDGRNRVTAYPAGGHDR